VEEVDFAGRVSFHRRDSSKFVRIWELVNKCIGLARYNELSRGIDICTGICLIFQLMDASTDECRRVVRSSRCAEKANAWPDRVCDESSHQTGR